jgi:hypothetical protein
MSLFAAQPVWIGLEDTLLMIAASTQLSPRSIANELAPYLRCLAFVAAVLTTLGGADLLAAAVALPDVAPSSNITAPPDSAAIEIAVLKASLADERKHNEAVLSTVYWSLAVLATMGAALIGFGWLANFRFYERDKDALSAALKGHMNTGLRAISRRVRYELESSKTAVASLGTRLEEANHATVRQLLDSRVAEMHAELVRLRKGLAEIELEQHAFMMDDLFKRGMDGNGFNAALRAIGAAQRAGHGSAIQHILDKVEKHLRSMKGIFATDLIQLTEAFDSLEGVNPIQKDRLSTALRDIKKI